MKLISRVKMACFIEKGHFFIAVVGRESKSWGNPRRARCAGLGAEGNGQASGDKVPQIKGHC